MAIYNAVLNFFFRPRKLKQQLLGDRYTDNWDIEKRQLRFIEDLNIAAENKASYLMYYGYKDIEVSYESNGTFYLIRNIKPDEMDALCKVLFYTMCEHSSDPKQNFAKLKAKFYEAQIPNIYGAFAVYSPNVSATFGDSISTGSLVINLFYSMKEERDNLALFTPFKPSDLIT